jgi:methionyl aminopeptidase
MRKTGACLAELFEMLAGYLQPGMTTEAVDAYIGQYLVAKGMRSETQGFHGYRHVSCISMNDAVVHGVPTHSIIIGEGDLIKIDVCASLQGYCADMARVFVLGTPTVLQSTMIEVGQKALDAGIAQAVPHNRIGDISSAIQQVIVAGGYGIVRDFAGHGIGTCMHQEPEILNYGKPHSGPRIKEGMAFAIEPMLTAQSEKVYIDDSDGWTVKTVDGGLAVHIEDTVIVTDQGPEIITRITR